MEVCFINIPGKKISRRPSVKLSTKQINLFNKKMFYVGEDKNKRVNFW